MSNERSRDFGRAPSHGPDQGGGERRDPGAEALLELARLIGQNDPFAPEAPKSGPRDARLADVSRAAASQVEARDSFMDRGTSRREPGFGEARMPPAYPAAEPPVTARGGDGFDFPSTDRGDFPVAPDGRDYDDYCDSSRGGRGLPAYSGQHDEYAGEYGDGDYEPEDYEDEEAPRRRRPTKMILAILGLAVFGSAAAYGYRTMVGAGPSGPTPIIRADNSPTKITPMSDVKPENGRINDRIGEQLVRRDEDPVDVGITYGADTAGGAPDIVPSSAGASPGDPRRVHTVPIRADQGTASSPDRPVSAERPTTRAVTPPPAPQPRPAAAAPPQPAPPPQQRQAALSPPSAPPAASPGAPPDAAMAPGETGGYVVQLSAVRSEADAQTAFRQLQAKYPVLSGRQPLIRRKDQGDRGIFFAAQVGPFGAKSDADQLCEQLKSQGGSCFVHRN